MEKWHLLFTKPQQEKLALTNLMNQGYEAYLPKISKEKISHGKKVAINEPMFPRYLFVRLNDNGLQNWSPIRSTKGVSYLVNFRSYFATLDDEIINHLKQNITKKLTVNAFSEGDKVEIMDGPFKGLEAIFRTYNGEERAIILLDFMTKKIDIKFNLGQFKKLA